MHVSASEAAPNSATYQNLRVVKSYDGFEELFASEISIFDRFRQQFSGRVLDIAVGGGRTTRALLPNAASYVGFDFSAGMVALAKQFFPQADLRQLDMRDTPREFAGQKFDAILISFNGVDYITWDERNQLLAALRGLLAPGGVLAFSTHDLSTVNENRGFRIREDLRPDWNVLASSPLTFAKRLIKIPIWVARALPNYLRHRPLEKIFDGFAYVNDNGENYGLLTCYVSTARQISVLETCGFENVDVMHPYLSNEPVSFNYFVCTAAGR
jgi:SAM-dependent methyltransferase